MAACSISAVLACAWDNLAQMVLLAGWGGALVLLMRLVDTRWEAFLELKGKKDDAYKPVI
jgi:hypothetical protein